MIVLTSTYWIQIKSALIQIWKKQYFVALSLMFILFYVSHTVRSKTVNRFARKDINPISKLKNVHVAIKQTIFIILVTGLLFNEVVSYFDYVVLEVHVTIYYGIVAREHSTNENLISDIVLELHSFILQIEYF